MTTHEKIATRILYTVTAHPEMTLVQAAGSAAWDGIQEAKAQGWTDRELIGMAHAFAAVAAEMHTAAS